MPWSIHTNAVSSEFIASLRDWAISNRVDERFIHRLDELGSVEDVQAELETAHEELTQAEDDRDDLLEELESLVKAIDENVDPDASSPEIEVQLKVARDALERHTTRPTR